MFDDDWAFINGDTWDSQVKRLMSLFNDIAWIFKLLFIAIIYINIIIFC